MNNVRNEIAKVIGIDVGSIPKAIDFTVIDEVNKDGYIRQLISYA